MIRLWLVVTPVDKLGIFTAKQKSGLASSETAHKVSVGLSLYDDLVVTTTDKLIHDATLNYRLYKFQARMTNYSLMIM